MQRSIEQDVKGLEDRYWQAIQRRDAAVATSLSDDECIVVGPQGVGALPREQLGQMLERATYELTHYEIDDRLFRIKKLTEDVVVAAYQVRSDLVVDGKPESVEAYDASVWVRRGDTWVCALHTESLKGDPFGRRDVDRLGNLPAT